MLSAVVADGMMGDITDLTPNLLLKVLPTLLLHFWWYSSNRSNCPNSTNVKNGGRTPIAGIMHAITLLIIMLVFGKYAGFIPMSCLAGILIVVAYNMSEWRTFVSILRGSAFDIIILLSTFILTVAVDLTIAIQVGVVLSALLFMKRMSDIKPELSTSIDSDILDNYSDVDKSIGIYEISGPFFFASAKRYGEVIKTSGTKYKVLIIRMRHVPFIDSTGIKNLKEAVRFVQHEGTKVVLSGVNPQVHSELEKYRIVFMVGKANIFPEFSLALDRANQILVEDEERRNS